jgi:POT family proton-dependent oligopeptide transporter
MITNVLTALGVLTVIGIVGSLILCPIVIVQMRKHPKGLHILFFAEMWERFSFYGMRGLLVFYLTQHFIFDDKFANGEYGTYMALVYLLPLLGGYLADKYLGTRKAVAFGALLLVAGHFLMGVDGPDAKQVLKYHGQTYDYVVEGRGNDRAVFLQVGDTRLNVSKAEGGGLRIEDEPLGGPLPKVLKPGEYELAAQDRNPLFVGLFYLALSLIIVGVGYLKANISSMVGQLYAQGDPRRDPGFTLYYFGINLGAFWAAVICGGLGVTVGWWLGFGLAGVGMLLGWLVFTRRRLLFFLPGQPQLPDHLGGPPDPARLAAPAVGPISLEKSLYLLAIPFVAIVWVLVQRQELTGWMLLAGGFVFLAYLLFYMIRKCTATEAQRLILALVLIIASAEFWTLFEQAGSSMNQFAERSTQLPNNGFFTITAAQTQAFNGGFILLCAPVFAALWAFLGRRGRDLSTTLKFGLALIQVGLGFWLLVWGASFADASFRVPLIFLVGAYFLHTTGEMCLSPVGLSAMTKLSPRAIVSFVMAGWFLSQSAAEYLAGLIAKLTATETVAGQVLDPKGALANYTSVFWTIGLSAVLIGLGLAAASFLLQKLAHEQAEIIIPQRNADPAIGGSGRPLKGDV